MNTDAGITAKVEHYIVSTVASVVPEPIRIRARELWAYTRELWESLRKKDTEVTGDGQITAKAEAVGRWGVEQAQERHDEEASKLIFAHTIMKLIPQFRVATPCCFIQLT